MRFAQPLYLLLFLPIALLIYIETKKKRGTISFSSLSSLKKFANRGRLLRQLPLGLAISSLCLIVLALARPQKGRVYLEQDTKGIDIMLCLDISGTMQAEDFTPRNRLYVAKERAKDFIERRQGDRIGLVIFAAEPLIQCPLTSDHKLLSEILDRTDFGILPDGTAIGMGLAASISRLKSSISKEKVIILLTDGLNNTGEVEPITAAKLASAYNIKVYCIGVGSKGPVPIPVYDPRFGKHYVRAKIDFDMNTLNSISQITGGRAFLATDAQSLKLIYGEIDKLEPTTFKVKRHTLYSERAGIFMFPAMCIMLVCLLLSSTILGRLP